MSNVMAEKVLDGIFQTRACHDIGDEELKEYAELFSTHYGVWGEGGVKPQTRVKMNAKRLRDECFGDPSRTVIAACRIKNVLVGHAVATTWAYDGGSAGWITQLVVDKAHRRKGIATHLLQKLREDALFKDINVIGLVSSHPAACSTLLKYSNVLIQNVDLKFIQDNAAKVLESTSIKYLKAPLVLESLSGESGESRIATSLFTNFFVDHREPQEVRTTYENAGRWRLGNLLPGHEHLVMVSVDPEP